MNGDTATSPPPDTRETRKRPFGIYAIIVLLLLNMLTVALDIVRIQSGLRNPYLILIYELLSLENEMEEMLISFIGDDRIILYLNIVILLALATVVAGLWLRARWAWVLTMLFIGIGLVYNIWQYLQGTPQYFNMLINTLVVFYLNERTVQQTFARQVDEEQQQALTP